MKTALYPGTFDPVTNGHLDILRRACRVFDRVIIGIARNVGKNPTFSPQERLDLIRPNLTGLNAEAVAFDGLVVDFARSSGASALIRGLRAVSDFEYEFQMTQMNRDLDDSIETIFFMPTSKYFFTSSSLVKQVATIDPGRITKYVPPNVGAALARRALESAENQPS